MNKQYDVVILGGGPAGLAAAIAIRDQLDVSVLLLERQADLAHRVGENCPPETLLLLKRLGIAADFYRDGHQTCPGYASVWGRDRVGYNDFIVNPMGPSWRIDRNRFDGRLASRARELGADLCWTVRFQGMKKNAANSYPYQLQLCDTVAKREFTVRAGFVVDASGFQAIFARELNIQKKIDDQLFAVVRFAEVSQGQHSQQIHLEARPEGWCYHTLIPGQRAVSMMVVEQENLAQLRRHGYQGLEAALASTQFISQRLNRLQLQGLEYHVFPICSGALTQVEGPDWLAIGDAALSFDPIAAQGVYKALSHGLMAAEKVTEWQEHRVRNSGSSRFTERLIRQYRDYLQNRAHVYSLEQRWPHASFWRNRMNLEKAA